VTDYPHPLSFGTVLTPVSTRPGSVVAMARLTEAAGLDMVSVPDHPYQPRFLEAWTVLSVVAAHTTRVRLLPNVANLGLRPPALLARSAASLDLLSGGRVELGMGAGGYWDAIAAEGGALRSPAEAVAATREAISVIRALWTPGPPARVDGTYHHLDGATPGPTPAHPIGIWIGALGPAMLRLIGRHADGWLPSSPRLPPDALAAGRRIVDESAADAGRDPARIRRLYNIVGEFGRGAGFLLGRPGEWAEQLAEITLEHGVTGYLLATDHPDTIRRFAAEVVPAVRKLVAAERDDLVRG
jgi:alkanesulfonate monooxygenase SsuD/methylene tetrahydromethanopterin reductase-like flavin-dependent oxidoreductase (luciferase family)